MNPSEQAISSMPRIPTQIDKYLVMLKDDVDVQRFINDLSPEIQNNITSDWSIGSAKGIAGTFFPSPSFSVLFLTCPGRLEVEVIEEDAIAIAGGSGHTVCYC